MQAPKLPPRTRLRQIPPKPEWRPRTVAAAIPQKVKDMLVRRAKIMQGKKVA